MHLLAPDHEAALCDPLTWRDNPFVRREAQRDRKRKQPLKQLTAMCITILILCGFAYWVLWKIILSAKGVPWFLGGDLGTAVCALIAGVHVYYVMGASTKHTLALFTQEAARQTLSHLLLLPITPFQLLLQAMVYPWLVAMQTGVLLLPVYALCVGLGGVSWGDLLMLYVVFGILAISIPLWRRPALSDAVASGQVGVQPPQANAGMGMGAAGTQQNQNATAATGQANSGSQGSWTMLLFIPVMFSLFGAMSSGRGMAGWYTDLKEYIPESVLVLLPSVMLSWPLLLARALVTPFNWYGFGIIPLPFVLFSMLAGRYLQLVRTAEYLQVGTYRDLALLPTYLPRRKWEVIFRVFNLFVLIGYLWKWLIWRGGLSWIAGSSTSGLQGFLFVLLVIGSWQMLWRAGMIGRWIGVVKVPENATAWSRLSLGSTLRFLMFPIAQVLTLFALCCFVGHTSPFSMSLFALGGKMLAIGFAGALFGIGSTRILGIFTYIGLAIIPLVGYDPTYRSLLHLSPTYNLFALSKISLQRITNGILFLPVWWHSVFAMLLPGLILTGLALAILHFKRKKVVVPEDILRLDPTRYGAEIWLDATTVTATTNAKTESPFARRLVEFVQKFWDNAVGIKELRVGWRGKFTARSLQGTFLTYAAITCVGLFALPMLPQYIGGGIAAAVMGEFAKPSAKLLSAVIGCWYLPLLVFSAAAGLSLFSAYAGERDKSTLGFLLMTPMRPASVVAGKMFGMLGGAGSNAILFSIWILFLSLILTLISGQPSPLVAWAAVTGTCAVVALTLGLLTLSIASIFWKAVRPAMFGWLWAIGIQLMIQSGNLIRWILGAIRGYDAMDTTSWAVLLGVYLGILLLLFGTSVWGIKRMRKGDIAFASKRDN